MARASLHPALHPSADGEGTWASSNEGYAWAYSRKAGHVLFVIHFDHRYREWFLHSRVEHHDEVRWQSFAHDEDLTKMKTLAEVTAKLT